jgi:hypothetical protein
MPTTIWIFPASSVDSDASNEDDSDASAEDDRQSNASESSWIVTPPGCFAGPVWEEPERNELEDLLIEHPSMSVYNTPSSETHAMDDEMNLATVQPSRTDVVRSLPLEQNSCRLAYPTRPAKNQPKMLKRQNMTQNRLSKKVLRGRRCIWRGNVCPRKRWII